MLNKGIRGAFKKYAKNHKMQYLSITKKYVFKKVL